MSIVRSDTHKHLYYCDGVEDVNCGDYEEGWYFSDGIEFIGPYADKQEAVSALFLYVIDENN